MPAALQPDSRPADSRRSEQELENQGPPASPPEMLRRAMLMCLPVDHAAVLLAVSGGSDSVALLGAAAGLRAPAEVVHVHHGLRADADIDAALVADLARQHGLRFHLLHAPPDARHPGRSETAARQRRYGALTELARQRGSRHVLTAHHLDDDLETLLLHARRGHRGARATCGVPSLRPLSADASVQVLRPFAMGPQPPGRACLAAWRESLGVPCVEDPSNSDVRIPRNAVRAWLSAPQQQHARLQLSRLRRSARRRLQQQVAAAVDLAEHHLHVEGLGSRLDKHALDALTPETPKTCESPETPDSIAIELLRLIGFSLAVPRRIELRSSVVAAWLALGRRGSGEFRMPATPAPLLWRAGRAGWHLPDAALRPGSSAARLLTALRFTSLYL